jgi:aminoglycoside phosphotransferase family enzyme/predicted kinase
MRETHSSVVFFVGDRVHKMKKPLDLGFLDNRTRAAREWICHREVELNRRLAPDVYLGVADMHDPGGEVCEHFVVMTRLPDDRRMAALIERGEDIGAAVEDVARQVSALHAASPLDPDIDRCATAEFVAQLWQLSLDHLDRLRIGREAGAALARIRSASERYLQGRTALFDERVAAGRAVDGHGDMLCDDIFCMDDGTRIIDCLEFDDELRYGDAVLDLAFLAMDFERLGVIDAARTLLDAYAVHAHDHPPVSLVHHYIAYRALVRAKVTALRHEQGDADSRAAALGFLAQVERNLDRGRVRLVLVGGVAATGMSTLSRAVGRHLGATVLRSDVIRKELAGMAPTERTGDGVGSGLYSAESTEVTYRELCRRAAELLARGESVVLDATWLAEEHRGAAREVAASTTADLIEVECTADREVLVQRIESRTARGDDASDATHAVLDEQLRRRNDWPDAVVVDTTEGSPIGTDWLERELGHAPW